MTPKMNTRIYKLMLWKAYFDKGYGWTSIFKWFIAFYGMSSLNTQTTMIIAVVWAVFCFIIGWLAYRWGWVDAEIEVNNRVNPFVKEMRKKFK